MSSPIPFAEIARLPLSGDNVAIATTRLEAGTLVEHNGEVFTIDHTVMEGHRFALAIIEKHEPLLSWQLPFGYATAKIFPGSYVINPSTLAALSGRQLDFDLPAAANFIDRIEPYQLDEETFRPAEALPLHLTDRTFLGYRRSGARGVGTRNYVVLLGTTSRVGPFVKRLEARLQAVVAALPNVDGVVAIAHTEGGEDDINNLHLVLPTLAGFMVNPNVGAVLAVDDGVGPVNNAALLDFMTVQGYALDDLPHQFLTIETSFSDALDRAQAIVQEWLPAVNQTQRTPESLSNLKIALQCGGSDAFSGVSGNPLVGWVAREVIRYGGSANLAETDELIGAESYLLQKVRDLPTARKFLATVERFKEWAAWHGTSAEGNPSGGNKYRGLYNIVLKSIGAAMKRDPDVRLDYVIDYSEPMTEPGYYFMDSPGNDLESIAGQVASGCNLIFFVTGNGSITNFPFVPTIKVVTTSERYRSARRRHGRQRRGLPRRHAHGRIGRGHARSDRRCGLGRVVGRRTGRPRAGAALAQLASGPGDNHRSSGPDGDGVRASVGGVAIRTCRCRDCSASLSGVLCARRDGGAACRSCVADQPLRGPGRSVGRASTEPDRHCRNRWDCRDLWPWFTPRAAVHHPRPRR